MTQTHSAVHPEQRHLRRIREYWDLVALTASYRYSVHWADARQLMTQKGYAPENTIQASCDQGRDVNCSFVLPDGTPIDCDFAEDPVSRQATRFNNWETLQFEPSEENEYYLAAEILRDPKLKDAFDRAVLAYFDFHCRADDRPLPPTTR